MLSPKDCLSSRASSLSHGVASIVAGGFGGGGGAGLGGGGVGGGGLGGPGGGFFRFSSGPSPGGRSRLRTPGLLLVSHREILMKTPTFITCGDGVSNCAGGTDDRLLSSVAQRTALRRADARALQCTARAGAICQSLTNWCWAWGD